ncbi:hypothetical protein EYF80_058721 [Liparis tanakae]|uniref:Uncharacterized protein n=1 Tax=Liparis tanakae TaxID=230148 RepID=A0A4Z2EQD9_9TELE|nr:hypothetical protein EYF80_058721 [Liparis tanakae]
MSLYPSLEDLKVDKVIKVRVNRSCPPRLPAENLSTVE